MVSKRLKRIRDKNKKRKATKKNLNVYLDHTPTEQEMLNARTMRGMTGGGGGRTIEGMKLSHREMQRMRKMGLDPKNSLLLQQNAAAATEMQRIMARGHVDRVQAAKSEVDQTKAEKAKAEKALKEQKEIQKLNDQKKENEDKIKELEREKEELNKKIKDNKTIKDLEGKVDKLQHTLDTQKYDDKIKDLENKLSDKMDIMEKERQLRETEKRTQEIQETTKLYNKLQDIGDSINSETIKQTEITLDFIEKNVGHIKKAHANPELEAQRFKTKVMQTDLGIAEDFIKLQDKYAKTCEQLRQALAKGLGCSPDEVDLESTDVYVGAVREKSVSTQQEIDELNRAIEKVKLCQKEMDRLETHKAELEQGLQALGITGKGQVKQLRGKLASLQQETHDLGKLTGKISAIETMQDSNKQTRSNIAESAKSVLGRNDITADNLEDALDDRTLRQASANERETASRLSRVQTKVEGIRNDQELNASKTLELIPRLHEVISGLPQQISQDDLLQWDSQGRFTSLRAAEKAKTRRLEFVAKHTDQIRDTLLTNQTLSAQNDADQAEIMANYGREGETLEQVGARAKVDSYNLEQTRKKIEDIQAANFVAKEQRARIKARLKSLNVNTDGLDTDQKLLNKTTEVSVQKKISNEKLGQGLTFIEKTTEELRELQRRWKTTKGEINDDNGAVQHMNAKFGGGQELKVDENTNLPWLAGKLQAINTAAADDIKKVWGETTNTRGYEILSAVGDTVRRLHGYNDETARVSMGWAHKEAWHSAGVNDPTINPFRRLPAPAQRIVEKAVEPISSHAREEERRLLVEGEKMHPVFIGGEEGEWEPEGRVQSTADKSSRVDKPNPILARFNQDPNLTAARALELALADDTDGFLD